MPQCFATYAGPTTGQEAILEHESIYGPPPRFQRYTYMLWPDPGHEPGYFFEIGCEYMAKTFRMVTNYELGSPAQNAAVTTSDWVWLDDDDPPSNAYETVEAKMDTFLDDIKAYIGQNVYLTGYRWSEWKSDYSGTEPSFRFATRNLNIGAANPVLPPQVACAVTEETAIRRRWGRFYIPFLAEQGIAGGRFSNQFCNVVGAAAVDLLATVENEWMHVTVSSKEPRLLETEFVRVDNVPDVIRSRRWQASSFRYRSAVT